MQLYPKFIIVEDSLYFGKCVFHKDLSKPGEKVTSGGWFYFNPDDDTFTFYGT